MGEAKRISIYILRILAIGTLQCWLEMFAEKMFGSSSISLCKGTLILIQIQSLHNGQKRKCSESYLNLSNILPHDFLKEKSRFSNSV